MKIVLSRIAAIMLLSASTSLQAAGTNYCGELKSSFGPFDYTDGDDRKHLPIVEQAHFTANVQNLVKGESSTIGDDLNYTLLAFPNHHRALSAMANLARREKTPRPPGAKYPVECYFDRAIRFRPRDGIVRMIYGNYLEHRGEAEKAFAEFKEASRLEPENANIHYNLGLLYLKKKDYEQANAHAKKAYALGFPLPWLKNKLVEAGKWNDEPGK